MFIKDDFEIDDEVSGLKIKVKKGKLLNVLHIETSGQTVCSDRDFYFMKNGEFDGTGSPVEEEIR